MILGREWTLAHAFRATEFGTFNLSRFADAFRATVDIRSSGILAH